MKVVSISRAADARDARLARLREEGPPLDQLTSSLGTADEWLTSAIEHLKASHSEQVGGFVRVSSAAVSLVLFRLEQLEQGGEPWGGNAA